jgi:branched-chain amino acid aminotransferase
MSEVEKWAKEERLLEAFAVGTAVTVVLVSRIGLGGLSQDANKEKDLVFPERELRGSIANGLWETLSAIQTGKMQFEDWNVTCA